MFFSANRQSRMLCVVTLASFSAVAHTVQAQEMSDSVQEPQPATEQVKKEKKVPQSQVKKEKKKPEGASYLWPEWKPAPFKLDLRPVLGFQYSTDSESGRSLAQGELGVHLGLRGVSVVEGNPGLQIEPAFGYAIGRAALKMPYKDVENGNYRRVWGGLQTPIYYKFIRQIFAGRYGVISGGPLETSKRLLLQSDTGVAIVPRISGHYTLTYERSSGENSYSPVIVSVDHWLHAHLSSDVMNFFVDFGPGFSNLTQTQTVSSLKSETKTSETYFLALSGFDILSDTLGLEAHAKYVFSSKAEDDLFALAGRSPIDDLGADARRVGLPEDSFHASAFFGVKRILGSVGVGWRYNLEILNLNERNNTKQSKTESNGLGVFASFRF